MKTLQTIALALSVSTIVTAFALSLLFSTLIYISYGWDGFKLLPQLISTLR